MLSGRKVRWLVVTAVAAVVVAAVAWWALPRVVAALPGRVRHYVPDGLAALVTTPLPTALPAPAGPDPAALQSALGTRAPLATTAPPEPTAAASASPESTAAAEPLATQPASPTAAPLPTEPPSPTEPPPPTAVSLPPRARIDGLPIIPQKFNNCGPTNLTIVLNHYGVDVDQFDVAAVARPNYEDRNVSPGELVAYVNAHTPLAASAYSGGTIDLLRRLIDAGFPVIIEKGLEPDAAIGWMGHYLTVFGYDDITGNLLVRDTYLGPWQADGMAGYRDTERYWAQFNYAFIVVHPPERAGEVAALLGPGYTDAATMWGAATDWARLTLRGRPDDPFAWFNLGTSLTELARLGDEGLYGDAAAAFDQARLLGLPPRMLWYQFGPYEAYLATGRADDVLALAAVALDNQGGRNVEETHYYQGRALAMSGDEAGARAAWRRAAALNPESGVGLAAREALGE